MKTIYELVAFAKQHTHCDYIGDNISVARVLGHHLCCVDTQDLSVSPPIMFQGIWEADNTKLLLDTLKPGDTFVDIGAHNGYFSIIAGATANRVYACEPGSRIRKILMKNMVLNSMLGVKATVFSEAVSDADDQEVELHHNPSFLGGSSLGQPIRLIDAESITSEIVKTKRLDTLMAQEPRVDIVKIDVEGAELRVWRGMQEVWKRSPQIRIFMEYVVDFHRGDDADLLTEIRRAGGVIRAVSAEGTIKAFDEKFARDNPSSFHTLWITHG